MQELNLVALKLQLHYGDEPRTDMLEQMQELTFAINAAYVQCQVHTLSCKAFQRVRGELHSMFRARRTELLRRERWKYAFASWLYIQGSCGRACSGPQTRNSRDK